MKNQISTPAIIVVVIVAIAAVGGIGYHFIQDSQPIYLKPNSKSMVKGNKLHSMDRNAKPKNDGSVAPATPAEAAP